MEPFTTFIWKRIFIQIGGVVAIAIILGGFVLAYNATYNSIVSLDQTADERWARVAGGLVDRYEGIPGLVGDLRSLRGADSGVFDQVAANLSRWKAAFSDGKIAKIGTETTNLEVSISELARELDGHPEMGNFRTVQDFRAVLEETGTRLRVDQSSYNEGVRKYNLAISSFPASLWAENWGFPWREYFLARIAGREPPVMPSETG
jgi:LemA protein